MFSSDITDHRLSRLCFVNVMPHCIDLCLNKHELILIISQLRACQSLEGILKYPLSADSAALITLTSGVRISRQRSFRARYSIARSFAITSLSLRGSTIRFSTILLYEITWWLMKRGSSLARNARLASSRLGQRRLTK